MAHVMDGPRTPFPLHLCLVLCGLMVSVPFLLPYHYFPFPTFYTEWFAFVIGLAALGVMGLAPSRHAVPVPAMSPGLFALTAVLVVMLGAWLGSEIGERPVSHSLQWWLAVAGALAAASGFFQLYHTPLPAGVAVVQQPSSFMFGVIGQSNNFANYLGAALLSVAFLHSRNVLGTAAALLMALLMATGMALSGSRTSWGYMGISLIFIPLLLRRDSPEAAGKLLRVAAFAVVVFSLVQVLNFYTDVFTSPEGRPYSAGERLFRYLESDSASGERTVRIQLFLYAWLMFLSNPILGVVFGEYAGRSFELAASLPRPVTVGLDRHPHNLFFQLRA